MAATGDVPQLTERPFAAHAASGHEVQADVHEKIAAAGQHMAPGGARSRAGPKIADRPPLRVAAVDDMAVKLDRHEPVGVKELAVVPPPPTGPPV